MLDTQQMGHQSPSTAPSANVSNTVKIRPIPGAIGAEFVYGDVNQLTPEAAQLMRQAWSDNLVLLVRNQRLDDPQLLAFARHFGGLEKAPVTSVAVAEKRPDPYVCIVSNVIENGVAIGSLGNDEAIWHTDMSHLEAPPAASILHALEIPEHGGETGFINMYLALETLSPEMRKRIEGLTIGHDGSYNSAGVKRRVTTSANHPIVITHPETRRHALYLGRRPHARINELSQDESDSLLDALWQHASQDRLAWHHSWKVGDILIWDNRCCLHHRNPFDASARRIMHRAQTSGNRPDFDKSVDTSIKHPRSNRAAH